VRAFGGGADSVSRRGWQVPVVPLRLGGVRRGCARRPGQGQAILGSCPDPFPFVLARTPLCRNSRLESIDPVLGSVPVLEISRRGLAARGEPRPTVIFSSAGEQSGGKKGWYFDSYLPAGLCGLV
jgi:hypothetical protein